MSIIILLIAVSLSIAILFLGLFLWNMKNGQYEDTHTPSVRMLFENTHKERPENDNSKTKKEDQKGSAASRAPT